MKIEPPKKKVKLEKSDRSSSNKVRSSEKPSHPKSTSKKPAVITYKLHPIDGLDSTSKSKSKDNEEKNIHKIIDQLLANYRNANEYLDRVLHLIKGE